MSFVVIKVKVDCQTLIINKALKARRFYLGLELRVENAEISTMSGSAKNVFYVTDYDGNKVWQHKLKTTKQSTET